MKLGLVTYRLAHKWDVGTIIKNCSETKFEGVELRTTHGHGVEVDLTDGQRAEVRKRFADSPVNLYGLGSAFEYHSHEAHVVRKNVEGTKVFLDLAKDVGAQGVKVRPNGFATKQGVKKEDTIKQIGAAYRECAEYGQSIGVKLWMEVHGRETSKPAVMRAIIDAADHPNAKICWNSNEADKDSSGSILPALKLLGPDVISVHMRDLWIDYPFVDLFAYLQKHNYEGFTSAEIPESSDPIRVMRFYRALWEQFNELAGLRG